MVNEHTVDYHPSPTDFQEYTLSYFYGLLSSSPLRNISWFFSKTCISHHGYGKVWNLISLKFMGLRLLENIFMTQKTESANFYSFSQAKTTHRFLSSNPRKKEIINFPWIVIFLKSIFPQQKGGRIIELKKWLKLNLRGYWSQVLINSSILATFTFLVCFVVP